MATVEPAVEPVVEASVETPPLTKIYTVMFTDVAMGPLWMYDFKTEAKAKEFRREFLRLNKHGGKIVRTEKNVKVFTPVVDGTHQRFPVINNDYESVKKAKTAVANLKILLPTERFTITIEEHFAS